MPEQRVSPTGSATLCRLVFHYPSRTDQPLIGFRSAVYDGGDYELAPRLHVLREQGSKSWHSL